MKAAFVFPGQGSQTVGMLEAYSAHPVVRQTIEEASDALGLDLWKLVATGPEDVLSLTTNTQPVMLAADVAIFRAWQAAGGAQPVVAAGHSLGEYSALVASGSIPFADAVRLVRVRAEAMQAAVPEGVGAIAAILGLDEPEVEAVCREVAGEEVVAPANINAPGQVVISGHRSAVERAIDVAKARGAKRAVMLPMSIPAHCLLMKPASGALQSALAALPVAIGDFPVIHNFDVSVSDTADALRSALVSQLYNPVRWIETVRSFEDRFHVMDVVECGPGKVLHGLTRRIVRVASCHTLSSSDAIGQVLSALQGQGGSIEG
ncbi:MAG: ACP S-malonyltransferase [Betaproteobacteria bacterium]|nr:ACP S-malonyltransferase [Betaproteobacteria bacterium]